MPLRVALDYDTNWYSTGGQRLMGANAASEGFFRNLVQHGPIAELAGYVGNKQAHESFTVRVKSWNPNLPTRGVHYSAVEELAKCDVFYRGDPDLSKRAWQRRVVDPAAWSLCGVTHTTCSLGALEGLSEMVTAPYQPWDAIICTSQAVRTTVEQVTASFGDYLASIGNGGNFRPRLELPVIPLGVDYDILACEGTSPKNRKTQRAALGIGDDAMVFLFLGRLVYHAKAHPLPMYLALQRAAEATGKEVHLVLAGWFGSPEIEKVFHASGSFCPKVKLHFVDGRRPEIRQQIWAAADVFISLVENIQETFGLTPLEAMAARLPIIVTDWDGYRESVRHEIDGILIPTYAAASGGQAALVRHYLDALTYDEYVASISQSTVVDVAAVTAACIRLIQHPEDRQRMGAAGQARVRESFAWPTIIGRYVELWEELKRRRLAAGPQPIKTGNALPWLLDPHVAFGHYPTLHFSPEMVLQLTADGNRVARNPQLLPQMYQHRLLHFVTTRGLLLEPPDVQQVLNAFLAGSQTAEALLPEAGTLRDRVWRTLGWLMKIDLLALVDPPQPRRTEE